MDLATCVASPGLELKGYEGPLFFLTDGSTGYLSLDGETLSRFDLGTGRVTQTSRKHSGFISEVALHDGEMLVLSGGELVRLDPTTLKKKDSKRVLECAYSPSFVKQNEVLYLLDDCEGALYRLSESLSPAEGWRLPLDEGSDIQISGFGTGEGIWFVDVDQSGEPYFVNPTRTRFEQIPTEVKAETPIHALVFEIHPKSLERPADQPSNPSE